MVAVRKTIPMTMSTTGPARERRRGGLITGAGMGLDILHLVGWWLRCLRRSARRCGRRRRVLPYFSVSFPRGVTAQQHHDTNYQDQQRPCAVPAETSEVLEQG